MKRPLSYLPQIVRSIFLSRQSAVRAMPTLPVERSVSVDRKPATLETVFREAVNIDGLIAALRTPGAEIARDAAMDLGRIGDTSAVEPLIAVLENAQGFFHPVVRSAAATSLGQLKDSRAVDVLIVATGDPMAEVSEEAALALGAIGDDRAIDPLLHLVANRAGFFLPPVRRAAIQSLGRFHDAKVASILLAVSVNETEDPLVRQAAKDVGASD